MGAHRSCCIHDCSAYLASAGSNLQAYRVGILAALMLGFLNTVLWIIASFFILIG